MFSCKKEQQTVYNIIPVSHTSGTFTLQIDKTINDSTLVLKWSRFPGKGFKQYTLNRAAEVFKNGEFTSIGEQLKTFTNPDSLTYLDKSMPFASDIQYTITAVADSIKDYTVAYYTYRRPNTYPRLRVSDALIDRQQKVTYLINRDSGLVVSYNYATAKVLKTTNLKRQVGYSALGSFAGGVNNELYMPTTDGWLYILDATTLTVKDKIYVEGDAVGSVVASNEKLFVSSSDQSFGSFYNNSLKIYDRKTKMVTGRTGEWNNTRLVLLPGNNVNFELVDIPFNLTPYDLNYYTISPLGVPLSMVDDPYHGDYPLDPNIIQAFPDGSRIISSSSGSVYTTKGLLFEKSLSPYGNFRDFAFNSSSSVIYCITANEKKITAISYPSATVQRTFTTQLLPVKIFTDGNQLICITMSNNSYYNNNPVFFVEKFNL